MPTIKNSPNVCDFTENPKSNMKELSSVLK